MIAAELAPKRLELLRGLVVSATVIALLINPNDGMRASSTRDVQIAAGTLGLQVRVVNAAAEVDFDTAFATIVNAGANALFVPTNALFINQREKLVALAARYAVPAR